MDLNSAINALETSGTRTQGYYSNVLAGCATYCTLALMIFITARHKGVRKSRMFYILYIMVIDVVSRTLAGSYYIYRIIDAAAGNHGETFTTGLCRNLGYEMFLSMFVPISTYCTFQFNALIASIWPSFYSRKLKWQFMVLCSFIGMCFDVAIAGSSTKEVFERLHVLHEKSNLRYVEFEHIIHITKCSYSFLALMTWRGVIYQVLQLAVMGMLFALQIVVMWLKKRGLIIIAQSDEPPDARLNPVMNSPFLDWKNRGRLDKVITVSLILLTAAVVAVSVIGRIAFLSSGRLDLFDFSAIWSSVFLIFVPLEIAWFNVDVRNVIIGRQKCKISSIPSHAHGKYHLLPSTDLVENVS